MYITSLRKNQSMQIKEITEKKKKGKMLVYEETRQKQKKKTSILTLQRGWRYPHPKRQDVQDGQHTQNAIWPIKCWNKYKHATISEQTNQLHTHTHTKLIVNQWTKKLVNNKNLHMKLALIKTLF